MDRYFTQFNKVWVEIPEEMFLEVDHLRVCIRDMIITLEYATHDGYEYILCGKSIEGKFSKFWLPDELKEYQNLYTKNKFLKFKELIEELKNQYG